MAQILDLRLEPKHIPTLAAWHHQQWAHYNPGDSIEKRIVRMQSYLGKSFIPSTFICKHNNQLVGSASIVKQDMTTHMDMTPWLASVYVAPQFRCQGFGSQLVKHLMMQTGQAGFSEMHLFTPDKMHFYEQLGWKRYCEENYHDECVTIMKYKF